MSKKETTPTLWDKKKTMQLISKYNEMPILWNTNSKDYRNRQLRARSFDELAKCMKLTRQEVQRKLHNLRTQYNTELRKLQRSGKREDCKWEYYDAIKFINPNPNRQNFEDSKSIINLDVNSSFSNIEFRDVQSVETSSEVMERDDEDEPRDQILLLEDYDEQPSRTFKMQSIVADVQDDQRTPKSRTDTSRDDLQIFGDFVASELRSLNSEYKRKKLRLAIQRAILDINELP